MKPDGPVFDSAWRASCHLSPITLHDAKPLIASHYLGRRPGVVTATLGMKYVGLLVGCVIYAMPPKQTSIRYGGITWELARLFIYNFIPSNAESWLIAKSVRWVKKNAPAVDFLVSYADPSRGHSGTVYRAANWSPDGMTDDDRKTPRFDYYAPALKKRYSRRSHVPQNVDVTRVPRVSKHRYILRVGRSAALEGELNDSQLEDLT